MAGLLVSRRITIAVRLGFAADSAHIELLDDSDISIVCPQISCCDAPWREPMNRGDADGMPLGIFFGVVA